MWRNFRLHPDLVLSEGWWLTKTGRPRAEPEIRVDQVRDLIGEIAGTPFEARRRVFVIDDAHTMNESAQNALLKSLEEPPPRSHVILVSSAPLGLRQTIRSRCQMLRFGPLPRAAVAAFLAERHGVPADGGPRRGPRSPGGSPGAALAFESEAYGRMREGLIGLLERAEALDPLARMEAAEALEQSEDPALLLTTLRSLLRDVAALRAGTKRGRRSSIPTPRSGWRPWPRGGSASARPSSPSGRGRPATPCAGSRTSSSPSTSSSTPSPATDPAIGPSILAPPRRRVLLVTQLKPAAR